MSGFRKKILGAAASICLLNAWGAHAVPFDINFLDGGGLSASQLAIFDTAEFFWESLIQDYQAPGVAAGQQLTITGTGAVIDGVGGVLGQAGPTNGFATGGFGYASIGVMTFDSADLLNLEGNGTLLDVIVHEMAHVIGFGTLWNAPAVGFPAGTQNVYTEGTGEYTGAHALSAYQAEFDPGATFVPVELGGGPGTANGHWAECGLLGNFTDCDSSSNPQGTFAGGPTEIMTGFLNLPSTISATTVCSFGDLGYIVSTSAFGSGDFCSAVTQAPPTPAPEPATLLLVAVGILFGARKRHSARL